MPTALPSGEKSAFIALINTQNPIEAALITPLLNNYEDIVPIGIARQLGVFADNPAFLKEAMAVFTDAALVAVGIYNNKSNSSLVTNPSLLVSSHFTAGISFTANQIGFGLLGSSTVNSVTVATGIYLQNLIIGPGSTLDILDVTAEGAFISSIGIMFAYSTPGFLNVLKYGSHYGDVYTSPGSYFGGIQNIDPNATCAAGPVTGLTASNITHDSILITWVPPSSGYIFLNVQYKKSDSQVWIPATFETGDFIKNTGYVFRGLDADTYYDFRIQTICNNGGTTYATTSSKTICCGGSGGTGSATSPCLITVYIKATPDITKMITLCDGTSIQQEYPEGPTLTIPYLAGKTISSDVIVSNLPYQLFPYDSSTGTWEASTTPLTLFQEPNIFSVQVLLPS